MTPSPLRDVDVGGNGVGGVEEARCGRRGDAGHRVSGIGEHLAAGDQARARHDEARRDRSVERQHLILGELAEHQVRHLLHLGRIVGGDVGVLRPVLLLSDVIQLELESRGGVLNRLAQQLPRRALRHAAQHPAVVVEALHPQHLEILGVVGRGRAGVGLVEAVSHADALDRLLSAIALCSNHSRCRRHSLPGSISRWQTRLRAFSRLFASAFVSRDKRRMVRGWRIAGRTLETIRQRPGAVVGEDDKGAKAMKPILLAAALTTAIPTAAAAHCYSTTPWRSSS